MPQTTLGGSVGCKGISLHSGREVYVEFKPGAENTGIVFHVHAVKVSLTMSVGVSAETAADAARSVVAQ